MVNDDYDDDEALLESVNLSTLHGLCETHSLPSHGTKVTAPVLPDGVAPNANDERAVTIYSTSDRNNLMSMTSRPGVADFSLDGANQTEQSKVTLTPPHLCPGNPLRQQPYPDLSQALLPPPSSPWAASAQHKPSCQQLDPPLSLTFC